FFSLAFSATFSTATDAAVVGVSVFGVSFAATPIASAALDKLLLGVPSPVGISKMLDAVGHDSRIDEASGKLLGVGSSIGAGFAGAAGACAATGGGGIGATGARFTSAS